MATYTLLLTHSPFNDSRHQLAQRFVEALPEGNSIRQVFLYSEAVMVANGSQQPPQGQESPIDRWLQLAGQFNFSLHACIANSLRRGITNSSEQARYGLPAATIDERISLVGLGDIAEAYINGDKVLQF